MLTIVKTGLITKRCFLSGPNKNIFFVADGEEK